MIRPSYELQHEAIEAERRAMPEVRVTGSLAQAPESSSSGFGIVWLVAAAAAGFAGAWWWFRGRETGLNLPLIKPRSSKAQGEAPRAEAAAQVESPRAVGVSSSQGDRSGFRVPGWPRS
jgi:hypothetical protein